MRDFMGSPGGILIPVRLARAALFRRHAPTGACRRSGLQEQPATHLPLPSNSIVLPLRAGYTARPFTSAASAPVRDSARILPPAVARSFTCDMITETGCTSELIA